MRISAGDDHANGRDGGSTESDAAKSPQCEGSDATRASTRSHGTGQMFQIANACAFHFVLDMKSLCGPMLVRKD